jgi:hypothetical protein
MINYKTILTAFMLVIIFLASPDTFAQGVKKEMSFTYVRWQITDSADEGEGSWGWGESRSWYFGFGGGGVNSTKGVHMACRDWTDPDGKPWAIWTSGHGQWEVDDLLGVMPVPDAEGWTIHRYFAFQPPAIVIDGIPFQDPFPLNFSDHVDADKVPGNADGLIESFINTDMGISIHQRVIGFSPKKHNQYIIKEYIFTNTGNTDLDAEIELEGQTVTDWYFLKQLRARDGPQRPWQSAIGQYPGDTLRVMYGYGSRENELHDDFGGSNPVGEYDEPWDGQLNNPYFWGEQVIFASAAPNDFTTDDKNQPHATMYLDVDYDPFVFNSRNHTTDMRQQMYEVMQNGAFNLELINWPYVDGGKPGTAHGKPMDHPDMQFRNVTDMPGYGYSPSVAYSLGPYTFNFGDSVKIVTAELLGTISPKVGYEVGVAWRDNVATWGDMIIGGSTDILPAQYTNYPDLLDSDDERSRENNWAKDNWYYTGFDSLVERAKAAKWAYDQGYTIPQPPLAPDIEVKSLPNNIRISWGSQSENAGDFAGYRVYRALGSWWPHIDDGQLVGIWEKVFECGEGTANALTHEFSDMDPQRGSAYFYSVTAFDNGIANGTDYDGPAGVLESSPLLNYTTNAATLVKPGGNLEDIVVVPNPYNISATNQNFPGEGNKIMFFNVPSVCTIRIFTETGDLVRVIEHEGAGDTPWGSLEQEWQATDIGQIVVSGLYIAHIETPDGQSTVRKFVVVR